VASIDRTFGDKLAAIDALRPEQHSLRVGWLFVAGTVTDDAGTTQRHFWPLLTRPMRVDRSAVVGSHGLRPAGDTELTERISDVLIRHELERAAAFGGGALGTGVAIAESMLQRLTRLRQFAIDAARAAGVEVSELVAATESPDSFARHDGLVVVAGLAVYAATRAAGTSHAASLRTWAAQPLDTPTAMHAMYADTDVAPNQPGNDGPGPGTDTEPSVHSVISPFLLTPAQRLAVTSTRSRALTVVNGAPGTGKSHTITAIACDALARRESVLVVAMSNATIDALVELFDRAPGPQPVVFGSNERKDELASLLADGLHPCTGPDLARSAQRLHDAVDRRRDLWLELATLLEAEATLAGSPVPPGISLRWPELREPQADLATLTRLLADCDDPHGWKARRRGAHSAAEVRRRTGADTASDRAALSAEIDAARMAQLAVNKVLAEGLELGSRWKELRRLDDEVRRLCAEWLELDARAPDRLGRASLAAVSALATGLRSGRSARREQLARMGPELSVALPLWAGTLADVDDLLPARLGLFDLVILDEASSVDQPTAASALLRGRRAVIVGDPKQLRHLSFLGDERRDDALVTAGIAFDDPLGARLDVRRNSVFDVATAATPPVVLDEHFRSAPHLIEFVAHRLYADKLRVAARSPVTEAVDCIHVYRTSGRRDGEGVVAAEVNAVLQHLQHLRVRGATSVGVISPFRAQADAIENAILHRFGVEQIEAMDLRVGTVHAFVGNERDVVIASIGLDGDASASSWRFVNDPHLFAVFATRARERFIVVRSADPPPTTLLADYLAQADVPPGPPRPARGEPSPWIDEIAQVLRADDNRTVVNYPTGRHVVDVCVGDGYGFFGVECSVHPHGADDHIERHLSLDRRGWPLSEAYESKWGERRGELFVQLRKRAELTR
jgi:hypothetical protein